MITVHCGFPDCDWKASEERINTWYTKNMKQIVFLNVLQSALLDHQVKVHNVPPAIWER